MQNSANEGVSMSRSDRYMPMNQAFNMIVFAKMPYQYGKTVMCYPTHCYSSPVQDKV